MLSLDVCQAMIGTSQAELGHQSRLHLQDIKVRFCEPGQGADRASEFAHQYTLLNLGEPVAMAQQFRQPDRHLVSEKLSARLAARAFYPPLANGDGPLPSPPKITLQFLQTWLENGECVSNLQDQARGPSHPASSRPSAHSARQSPSQRSANWRITGTKGWQRGIDARFDRAEIKIFGIRLARYLFGSFLGKQSDRRLRSRQSRFKVEPFLQQIALIKYRAHFARSKKISEQC